MSTHDFKKGAEDAKSGRLPDPPGGNSLSDYVFFTYRSDKDIEDGKKDYMEGYKAGSNHHNPNDKK